MIKILLSLLVISSLMAVDNGDVSYTTKTYRSIGTQTAEQKTDEDYQKESVKQEKSNQLVELDYFLPEAKKVINFFKETKNTDKLYYKLLENYFSNTENFTNKNAFLYKGALACLGLHQSEKLEDLCVSLLNILRKDLLFSADFDDLFSLVDEILYPSNNNPTVCNTVVIKSKYEAIKKSSKINNDFSIMDFLMGMADFLNEIYYHSFFSLDDIKSFDHKLDDLHDCICINYISIQKNLYSLKEKNILSLDYFNKKF